MLSSEEEEVEVDEEDPGTSHVHALEGAKEPYRHQKPVQTMERKKIPEAHILPSDMNSQVSITGEAPGESLYPEFNQILPSQAKF